MRIDVCLLCVCVCVCMHVWGALLHHLACSPAVRRACPPTLLTPPLFVPTSSPQSLLPTPPTHPQGHGGRGWLGQRRHRRLRHHLVRDAAPGLRDAGPAPLLRARLALCAAAAAAGSHVHAGHNVGGRAACAVVGVRHGRALTAQHAPPRSCDLRMHSACTCTCVCMPECMCALVCATRGICGRMSVCACW